MSENIISVEVIIHDLVNKVDYALQIKLNNEELPNTINPKEYIAEHAKNLVKLIIKTNPESLKEIKT